MKINHFIRVTILCLCFTQANAQTGNKEKDTTSMETHRAQSGIDPITIKSRVMFTSYLYDTKGPSGTINNTAGFMIGIKKWYLGMYGSAVSVMTGKPGEGFSTGAGDVLLTVQNRIYMHGRHGVAITGAIEYPTGKRGFGTQYLSFTPVLTYLYAFNPSLIIVVQPQYTFHLMKDPAYPPLSLLSARVILAKFRRTGTAYGIEAKPAINLQSNVFYAYVSPFLSKALGAGFNLVLLADLPLNKNAVDKGPTYEIGLNRFF